MQCPSEIAEVITEILTTGLLRIRALGWNLNPERCAIEADHLHNLPLLLTNYKKELLDYYLRIERVAFIQQSSAEEISGFEPQWSMLAEQVAADEALPVQ